MQSKQKVGMKSKVGKKEERKEAGKKEGGKKIACKFVGFSLRDQLMMLEDPDYAPPGKEHPANFEHEYIMAGDPRHPEHKDHVKQPRWPNQIKPNVVQKKIKSKEAAAAAAKMPKKKVPGPKSHGTVSTADTSSFADENELMYQYDEE